MMMIGETNQVTRPNEGGGSMNHDGGDGGAKLKKGPWTVAEDSILAEYVRTHGEGNWNAVQKNTGLARCGKSCRLRWANHLRPNLKKGAFSPDEERIIIELHAKLGNKWARMAAQLPGRTDNEIKNYWNTRVKRKLRQGLSLYPPNIQPVYSQQQYHSQPTTTIASSAPPLKPIASSSSFQSLSSASLTPPSSTSLPLHRSASSPLLYNHQLASSGAPPPQPQPAPCLYSPGPASTPPPPPLPSPSPSTPPHASPLPYPHKPAFQTLPLFDSSTSNTTSTSITSTSDFLFPRHFSFLQTPLGYKRLRPEGDSELTCSNNHNRAVDGSSYNNTSSFMFPVSPLLRSTIFNPHATAAATSSLSPINYTSSSVDPMALDPASSTKILGSPHFDPQVVSTPGYVYPWKTELPSNQFWSHYVQSEVSLHGKGNNNGSSNNDHNENHNNLSMPINGSGLLEDMLQEAQVLAGSNDILRMGFDSSSDQGFASVLKGREAAAEEMNTTTQEDYTKYLNVISSSMPISEWYGDSGEGSNGQSSVITDDNLGVDIHDLANSILPVDITAAEPGRTSSSCRSWDNLRGFC